MAEKGPGAPATLAITVVACLAPREVREWVLDLPVGATVADALRASCGVDAGDAPSVGIWGRAAKLDAVLQPLDRVEIYRPLKVDPKVAPSSPTSTQPTRGLGDVL